MHQALYRKWRPKNFDEVCGQDHITSILKYEVANNKFSHAYLFCGSRGTGKTSCAKILAKAVNCLSPVNGDPCGVCDACRAIDSGSATDVLEMDAASNNGVDNIRDIRDEVVYSPSSLKYRVYIIDEVHMLSPSAFNALLKTLEEPPAHAIFILATTELHKLPATIISRCQRFDFRRITTEILKSHLLKIADAEGIEITDGAALLLAKHAQGGMRDAISLLDLCAGNRQRIDDELVASVTGSGGREQMLSVVRAVIDKDYDAIFKAIEDTVRSSRDITVFWQELIAIYRDLLVIKNSNTPTAYLDLTDSETEALTTLAKRLSQETLSCHSSMLTEAFLSMQRANAVRRIVAEITLVRMCDTRLAATPEAMLARIAALEGAIAQGGFARPAQSSTQGGARAEGEELSKPTEQNSAMPAQDKPQRKKAAPLYDDDDDMFRGDAPAPSVSRSANAPEKPAAETAKQAQSPQSGQSVRVLRPFRSRAEAMELMESKSPMLAAFFKRAKWFTDDSGRMVLKFGTKFDIDSMKMFDGEKLFSEVIEKLTGKALPLCDIVCECGTEDKKDDIIDKIVEASEENRN